jgi:hypothetical protein
MFTKLLKEIAGQPKPVLRNVTIQHLSEEVEETLKLIHATKTNAEEQYNISPEELAHFGGPETSTIQDSIPPSSVN